MAYQTDPESGGKEESPTLTIPGLEFDGKPGDIVSFKFVGPGEDGPEFQRVAEKLEADEPDEDEDLKTTLRRDMAAIPPEGEE